MDHAVAAHSNLWMDTESHNNNVDDDDNVNDGDDDRVRGAQETSGDDQDQDGTGPRHLPHEVAAAILDQLDAADAQRCLVEVNLFGLGDPHGEAVRQRCMRTKKRLLVRRGDTRALCYLAARGARFHMGHVRVAATHGHEDTVRWLLASGARDTPGCGAIESAAAGGHTGVLSCLLEAGRARQPRAGVLRAALLAATLGGHRDAARLLSDALGAAPEPMMLMAAALGGDLAAVQGLLTAHPRWTHLCARVDFGRIVVLASSDQWPQSEWTPFWRHPCARRLAGVGPAPRIYGDPPEGRAPRRLDLIGAACVSGNVDAVRVLWAAGAGVRDTWRDNLATWAALGSSRDALAFVASKRAEIERAHGDMAPGRMRTDDVLKTAATSRDMDLVRLAWTLFDHPRPHTTYFIWSGGVDMARFAIDNGLVASVAERARLMANAALNDGATAAYLIQHHADELGRGLAAMRTCLPRSVEAARLLSDRGLVVFTPKTVMRAISALRIGVVRYLVMERGLGMAPVARCRPARFAHIVPPPEPDADGLCWPPSSLRYLFRYADAELVGCLLDRCADPAERAHHTDVALCASVAFGRVDLFDALLARRTADPIARPLVFETPYHGHPWMRLDGVLLGRLVAALGAQGVDFARCNLLPWLGKRCLPAVEDLCRRGLYDPAPECARVQDASGHPWSLVRPSVADAAVSSRRAIEWLAARGMRLNRLCPATCSMCRNARDRRPPPSPAAPTPSSAHDGP
ncbi:ankyrin repeat domain containing protein [Pandoravirus japonicus]|uniref:Ankyrin repeat domain containing protein n=1 Tax=Pandoravirus japonicus TaxID=2823154 RepID=A0A811BRG5_9VIRU|nr:ankyrin repeat domain containing protein [Pandoravirus japonicus]